MSKTLCVLVLLCPVIVAAPFARAFEPNTPPKPQAEQPAPAPAADPVYLQLEARIIIAPTHFARQLGLDPSPVEALLTSDATVVTMPSLTAQVLLDAAAVDPRGRILSAPAVVARDGEAVSTLIAPVPTFVAMPAEADDAFSEPQVSCVLRGVVEDHGLIRITGLVLGGIDLALAEPARGDTAEAVGIPSVRFATHLLDGEDAMIALPFDLSAVYPEGKAPRKAIALLLIRATVLRDGLVAAPPEAEAVEVPSTT